MQLNGDMKISDSAAAELAELERILEEELSKGNPFITRESLRILRGGGKRLRPLLTILFASAGGGCDRQRVLYTAAAIETLHMATLVHDDTIDNASHRRGVETTFRRHGIHTAIYTGDWMLLRSLQILAKAGEQDSVTIGLLNTLADGMERICAGEIDQYVGRGRIPGVRKYFERVRGKTAAMFAAACAAGARASGATEEDIRRALAFGEDFGIAFQIRDDLMDMESTGAKSGKPVEHDLREGIITLPVILACGRSPRFRDDLRAFLQDPRHASVSGILREAAALGGPQLARAQCMIYIDRCYDYIGGMPPGRAAEDLRGLVSAVFREIREPLGGPADA